MFNCSSCSGDRDPWCRPRRLKDCCGDTKPEKKLYRTAMNAGKACKENSIFCAGDPIGNPIDLMQEHVTVEGVMGRKAETNFHNTNCADRILSHFSGKEVDSR